MNSHHEEQLKKFAEITLTDTERSFLDAKILNYLAVHKEQKEGVSWMYKIRGYYTLSPYSSDRLATLFYRGTTLALILILLSGGTLAFASTNALPGDFLYPIKVNVNEKIQETLTTSTEKKLVFQEKKIEKRLVEIKTLKSTGQLTAKNAHIAEEVLKQHVEEFSQTADTLNEEGKEGVVIATATKLIPVITEYTDTDLGTKEESMKPEENETSTVDTTSDNIETKKVETGIEQPKDTSIEKTDVENGSASGTATSATLKMMAPIQKTEGIKEEATLKSSTQENVQSVTNTTKDNEQVREKTIAPKTEEQEVSEKLAKSIQDQTDKISDVIKKISGESESVPKEETIPIKVDAKK